MKCIKNLSISGAFPINGENFMTPEQKAQFLPSVKSLISVLEKDNIDPQELNNLLELSRDLNELMPSF